METVAEKRIGCTIALESGEYEVECPVCGKRVPARFEQYCEGGAWHFEPEGNWIGGARMSVTADPWWCSRECSKQGGAA